MLAAAAIASGCGEGLAFRADDRLRFVSPPEHARIAFPMLVQWSIDRREFQPTGFDGSSDGRRGVFAVFVDSSPMRPGRHIDSLAEGDAICETSPGCPDRDWLAERGVYLTTAPRLALAALPGRAGRRVEGGRRRHEVTVVLLDGRGIRIGEAAWTRTFYAPRGAGA
jgi:hypothetical protein